MEGLAAVWKSMNKKPADLRAVRLAAYLKLGVLWGFACDRERWLKDQDLRSLTRIAARLNPLATLAIADGI